MDGGQTVYLGGGRLHPSLRNRGFMNTLQVPGETANYPFTGTRWFLWSGPMSVNLGRVKRIPGCHVVLSWVSTDQLYSSDYSTYRDQPPDRLMPQTN